MMFDRCRLASLAVLAAGLSFVVSCGDDSSEQTTIDEVAGEDAAAQPATFTYRGETGPENWGSFSPTCSEGANQSPIDLTGAAGDDIADIGFDYGEVPLAIFNNGHTIEVEVESGNTIDLGGTTYTATQFHFHAGSEHAIDGEKFPLEMHIVHESGDALAVVGVMIDVGAAENASLAPVFDNIPTVVSDEATTIEGAVVDLDRALPSTRTYYQYSGSLTTPPCSEGVSWQVLDTPIEISQAQLDAFTNVIDGNVRPLQPLNDRELVLDEATS